MIEIDGVLLPVPLVTRTVTNGEMVKAGRLHQNMELGAELPSTEEKYTCTVTPVESRRRLALARGRTPEQANLEACILKDALLAMKDEDWWAYKFELIGGWMTFLDPFLDVIQNTA